MPNAGLLDVPDSRSFTLRRVAQRLLGVRRVVLTTHVNADGDGCGSEAAAAAWLEENGVEATIVNPTEFPQTFRFLLHRQDVVAELGTADADAAIDAADLFLVLDTAEPQRVGDLAPRLPRERTLVVDHHPAGREVVGDTAVQDPSAAATGEMVYDLIRVTGGEVPAASALGAYVAMVSDTGSFRYSNTTPRVHAVAADLLGRGIDPEVVYRRLFATAPLRRLELLREALSTLRFDEEVGLAWMIVTRETADRLNADGEDFDGLIEHARSIAGTEVALLFRETEEGKTKISFRSNGHADVNRMARKFGGGGHVKAAGALVDGPADKVAPPVIASVHETLHGSGGPRG
ncbi:bifunctional oligoribonuclease/PAP phosphatase NrnA [Longimicrobium sp.]|uniref:DHH family phosphoesterase n=1 Tax=Longimicrobium sp. TaxID=2029185 RepID=UPI002B9E6B48|nr:bifunctional oligoribonuclease/PAP phosphatase NrnA [Longimicrobium sp.]HSU16684.1 bifunctional oligoribonuclease/PAP phosphatase NrnA [Longimicrobium sp.]